MRLRDITSYCCHSTSESALTQHLMEEMPEGQLMEAMPEGLLQPPGSPWQDQSALEPDRDEHQQMLYASYSAPLYTQCPPLQPPR